MTTKVKNWIPAPEELAVLQKDWADTYILDGDGHLFQRPYGAGYWLYGVEYHDRLGWLGLETGDAFDGQDIDHSEAIAHWRATSLTVGYTFAHKGMTYLRLNAEFARVAFNLGCRKWGEWWADETDLPAADEVVQYTAFGELRYG